MAISITAYRAAIGVFCNRIRNNNLVLKVPKCFFSKDSFSDLLSKKKIHVSALKSKYLLKSRTTESTLCKNILALTLFAHMLIALANDVESNPGPNSSLLTICHANVQSIRNKMLFIKSDLMNNFKIITLSETWLRSSDKNTDLSLPGYQPVFRKDRQVGTLGYGGVLAYISSDLSCKRRKDLERNDLEAMWLELSLRGFKFLLCVAYRPPNFGDDFWLQLEEMVTHIRARFTSNILIIGDLNADLSTRQGHLLSQFTAANNLCILNRQPTRFSNNIGSILDQCISSFANLLQDSDILPPIASSDHCVLALTFNLKIELPVAYQRLMWEFNNGNYAAYRDELSSTDWESCFSSDNIDVICVKWTDKLLKIAKKHIPNKLVTIRPRDKPWFNGFLRRLRRKKEALFKTFKSTKLSETWEQFKRVRSEYAYELKRIKHEYEQKQFENLANIDNKSSKAWWSLLKKVSNINGCQHNSIPPLNYNGDIITNDKEKANLFNNYFVSISSIHDNDIDINLQPRIMNDVNNFSSLQISEQEILDQLQILDVSKSYGPDGIPPRLLKEGGQSLIKILHRLFSLSLSTSSFPLLWKSANVSPLYKKDNRNEITNYRPISLLSSVSKIFEKNCI